jgi:hypothetical protein
MNNIVDQQNRVSIVYSDDNYSIFVRIKHGDNITSHQVDTRIPGEIQNCLIDLENIINCQGLQTTKTLLLSYLNNL